MDNKIDKMAHAYYGGRESWMVTPHLGTERPLRALAVFLEASSILDRLEDGRYIASGDGRHLSPPPSTLTCTAPGMHMICAGIRKKQYV